MPLSTSVIVSEVCQVVRYAGIPAVCRHSCRYAGIPVWREVSNYFREPLERSLLDFKDLIISKNRRDYSYHFLKSSKVSVHCFFL